MRRLFGLLVCLMMAAGNVTALAEAKTVADSARVEQRVPKKRAWKKVKDKMRSGCRVLTAREGKIFSRLTQDGFAALSMIITPQDTIFEICLNYLKEDTYRNFDVREGDRLHLKLEDNSIISLTSVANTTGNCDVEGGVMVGTVMVPISISRAAGFYTLSKENLQRIITGQVVKIRIETSSKDVDIDIWNNKFSFLMSESFDLLTDYLTWHPEYFDDSLNGF